VLQKFCVFLLVAVLLALVPAAYADSPDPTWIGGYWDDDDFDNVVVFVVNACAVEVAPLTDFRPLWTPLIGIELLQSRIVQVSLHTAASPRAPPL
jgi:hypothetical protein